MGFESGAVSVRMVELPRPFPKNWLERFAAHKAGLLETMDVEKQSGWVTGRHLLDTHLTEESAQYAGWIRLTWREAKRKVPAALLKAECKMEELARMAAEGKTHLKPKIRSEIKESVRDRLLPNMPPQLKAIPFVYRPGSHHLYVGALNDTSLDTFRGALRESVEMTGTPAFPADLGQRLKNIDLMDFPGASFSREMADVAMEATPGRDFLTWLWFKAEAQNGRVVLGTGQTVDVLIEGPLTFAYEGNGAFETVLRKGLPEMSAEARTSLLAGKKLRRATLHFALDAAAEWRFQLDADTFVVKSLKLPKSEGPLDAVSRFQERMIFLDQWRDIFYDLFGTFTELRATPKKWKAELEALRAWVENRPSRR